MKSLVEKIPGLYATAESLIAMLADPPADNKLLALRNHLMAHFQPGESAFVWTGIAVTARYIGSSLESFLENCYVLTADQSVADSTEQMKAFERTGGVLIATGAAVQGYSLNFVAGCINYDLPSSRSTLVQRLGRFLHYGRTVAFRTWVMRDSERSLRWEDDLLNRVMAPNGDVDPQHDWSEY
jgi:superfamily II DNA/RNA helicase